MFNTGIPLSPAWPAGPGSPYKRERGYSHKKK